MGFLAMTQPESQRFISIESRLREPPRHCEAEGRGNPGSFESGKSARISSRIPHSSLHIPHCLNTFGRSFFTYTTAMIPSSRSYTSSVTLASTMKPTSIARPISRYSAITWSMRNT